MEDNSKIYLSKGILDLSGSEHLNLYSIGKRPTLKILNLSYTDIKSLEGLDVQPNIMQLNVKNSKFSSLLNFLSVKNVSNINVENTPFSTKENYVLQLVVAFGESLRLINDKTIPKSIIAKAKKYPDIVRELLDKGWEFVYPCPSDLELKSIAEILGVSSRQTRISYEKITVQVPVSTQNPFTKRKLEILQRQSQMFIEYEKQLGILDQCGSYTDRISDLLGCVGVKTNDPEQILREVKKIVAKNKKQTEKLPLSSEIYSSQQNDKSKQFTAETEEKIPMEEESYNSADMDEEESEKEQIENNDFEDDEFGSPIKTGDKSDTSRNTKQSKKSKESSQKYSLSSETSDESAKFPPIDSSPFEYSSSAPSWTIDKNYYQPINESSVSSSTRYSKPSYSSKYGIVSEPTSETSCYTSDTLRKKRKTAPIKSKHIVENKLYGYCSREEAHSINQSTIAKLNQKRKSSAASSPKTDKEFTYSYEYETTSNGAKQKKKVFSKRNQTSIPRVQSVSATVNSSDTSNTSPPISPKMRFVSELDLELTDDSGTVEGDSQSSQIPQKPNFFSAEAYAGSDSIISRSIPEVESLGTISSSD